MALQNRVTPLGDIIAHPARGLVFGNRGCLHDKEGRIRRRYAGRAWIACRLSFKDRRRTLMQPGRYTELFFLDDATALAAGHRPCAECRREDYRRFVELWPSSQRPSAPAVDAALHAERLTDAGTQLHHESALEELPDGAFVLRDGAPWLVRGGELLRWTAAGYTDVVDRPAGEQSVVITPPSVVAVLQRGWRPTAVPLVHPSGPPPQVYDDPTDWVARHIRRYVETNGEKGHHAYGHDSLLLTTRGRRTGRLRRTALWYVRDGDRYLLVGSSGEPAWVRNVRANPAVVLQVRAETFAGVARVATAEERPTLVERIGREIPRYARSELPIVIVEPIAR